LEDGFFVVGYNGGEIYDAGSDSFIFRKSMSYDEGEYLLNLAYEKGFTGITYDSHQVLCKSAGEALDVYCRDLGAPYRALDDPIEYLKAHNYEPLKVILCTLKGRELLEKCRDEIEPKVGDSLYTLVTSDILLEIGPNEATKGKAVKKMAELLGVPFENCYAAGDEANDLSMIEETPHGIAMANAIESLKGIAEFVTDADCNHDGVAEIIYRIIL
ncbi:MAG: HAD hydrolase family protein, partial [Lachnospiraceae bacterium]|nr:HAD hydrolase family protein [Lachnospiraceae bacterium]